MWANRAAGLAQVCVLPLSFEGCLHTTLQVAEQASISACMLLPSVWMDAKLGRLRVLKELPLLATVHAYT